MLQTQNQVTLFQGYLSEGRKLVMRKGYGRKIDKEYERASTFHGIPIALRDEFSAFCKNIGLKGVNILYRGKSIPGVYRRPQSYVRRQYATSFAVYIKPVCKQYVDFTTNRVLDVIGEQTLVNGKVEVAYRQGYIQSIENFVAYNSYKKLCALPNINTAPAFTRN